MPNFNVKHKQYFGVLKIAVENAGLKTYLRQIFNNTGITLHISIVNDVSNLYNCLLESLLGINSIKKFRTECKVVLFKKGCVYEAAKIFINNFCIESESFYSEFNFGLSFYFFLI